jgi:WD repeat-containing protein 42A
VRQYDLREAPEDAARRVPLVNLHDPKVALTVLTINQAMPYLFATGGSAPYAFLYDRRMLRHVKVQWGTTPGLLESNPSQLVRLLTTPRSPIVRELTGLKFSTANPHELLGSWLDDEIYLLDIRSDHTPAAQNQPGPIGPVVRFRAGHATYTRNDDDGDSSDGLESIHGWYFTAEPEYQPPSGMPILSPAPDYPTYSGRINGVTIKDVSFLGLNDEYIVSGSDDGGAYIWDKASGRLLTILEGDSEIVNVIAANPQWPQLAISGLSHSVKIFEPYLGVIDESKEHMDRMIAEHGEGIRGDLKGMLRGSAWQNSMVLTWDDITNLRKDK